MPWTEERLILQRQKQAPKHRVHIDRHIITVVHASCVGSCVDDLGGAGRVCKMTALALTVKSLVSLSLVHFFIFCTYEYS